jgi:hypothetical protein
MNNELDTENKLLLDAWEAGQKAISEVLGDDHMTEDNLWLITMLSIRAVISNHGKADKDELSMLACGFGNLVKHMSDCLMAYTPVRH